MKDKIEVGEYIRANDGTIGKIIADKEEPLRYVIDDCGQIVLHTDIVKHSKNIIKLIEEGDYVNGDEVITVYGYDKNGNDKDGLGICEVDDDYAYYTCLEDIDIKSILTKEQFQSMEYKVGE